MSHLYVCPCCDAEIQSHNELEEDDEIQCNECATNFFWDGEELLETESEDLDAPEVDYNLGGEDEV